MMDFISERCVRKGLVLGILASQIWQRFRNRC